MSSPNPIELLGNRPSAWKFLESVARENGFVAVGVAPAGPADKGAVERFEAWIEKGCSADMGYLTRNKEARFDPRVAGIVKDANVVISLALPYADGATNQGFWAHVASHARARDYHCTVRDRLKRVSDAVSRHFPGSHTRAFVDTAPVMERTWALMAQVGQIGKSGALIVPQIGPKVLIGEIVCSSVPSISKPKEIAPFSLCDDCDRCIRACPTNAIVEPGIVDSSRCLAYWSIERRDEELPKEIADKMTLVFGCDVCTSVCPHNINSHCALEPPSSMESTGGSLSGISLMSDKELKALISETALARTGPKALRRNSRLAAANMEKK